MKLRVCRAGVSINISMTEKWISANGSDPVGGTQGKSMARKPIRAAKRLGGVKSFLVKTFGGGDEQLELR